MPIFEKSKCKNEHRFVNFSKFYCVRNPILEIKVFIAKSPNGIYETSIVMALRVFALII